MPRPTADDCRRIEACQVPPPSGCVALRWGATATATLARDGDVMELVYCWRGDPSEVWRETRQTIGLSYLACHFGGRQTYLACPRCSRRAIKLYHPSGQDGFMCRHCGRLAPQAQSEGSWQRALRRASKLRRYCGGDGDLSAPFPARPAGMSRKIYGVLRAEAEALESLPANAWLTSGAANVRLGVRRSPATRRWWPGRNAAARSRESI